jgi:hypothetical protein
MFTLNLCGHSDHSDHSAVTLHICGHAAVTLSLCRHLQALLSLCTGTCRHFLQAVYLCRHSLQAVKSLQAVLQALLFVDLSYIDQTPLKRTPAVVFFLPLSSFFFFRLSVFLFLPLLSSSSSSLPYSRLSLSNCPSLSLFLPLPPLVLRFPFLLERAG